MANWCITISQRQDIYEQIETTSDGARFHAGILAMRHGCMAEGDWTAADSWAYQRRIRLPDLLIPPKSRHRLLQFFRCALGKPCPLCDDGIRVLSIPGEDAAGNEVHQKMGVKVPGRRTLMARNQEGEYGVLRVALLFDYMLDIPPDPVAVREWEDFKMNKEKQVCEKV